MNVHQKEQMTSSRSNNRSRSERPGIRTKRGGRHRRNNKRQKAKTQQQVQKEAIEIRTHGESIHGR